MKTISKIIIIFALIVLLFQVAAPVFAASIDDISGRGGPGRPGGGGGYQANPNPVCPTGPGTCGTPTCLTAPGTCHTPVCLTGPGTCGYRTW